MLGTILLCFAFVFAIFATFGVDHFSMVHTGWAALAMMIASMIFGRIF